MRVIDTKLNGVQIIECFYSFDIRGAFIKIFNREDFQYMNIDMQYAETYYSISKKDTIRGMHFQVPPYEHNKLIHVIHGSVIDVIIDLRKNSPTYKQFISIQLTGNKPKAIYIPKGFAHGFKTLEDNTLMLYNVSSIYKKEYDKGIRWDSIGYNWNTEDPIISEKDRNFNTLEEFESPF